MEYTSVYTTVCENRATGARTWEMEKGGHHPARKLESLCCRSSVLRITRRASNRLALMSPTVQRFRYCLLTRRR